MTGLLRIDNCKTIVLAVETDGAASFNAAVKANKIVTIPAITSIAKSLGAKTVSEGTLRLRKLYGIDKVRSLLVTDKMAVDAVDKFYKDFNYLVEPACGASLACVYSPTVLKSIIPELVPTSTVCVEVCGGFQVSLALLEQWKLQCP